MPIDYGDQVSLQDVDRDDEEEVTLHPTEVDEEDSPLPEGIDNKLKLPETYLNYAHCHGVWSEYYGKVLGMEGWGVKTLQEEVRLVSYHLDLAATHLEKVRTSLETVNSEKRQRAPRITSQVKVFTVFFNKLDAVRLDAQVKLFNVQPISPGRTKDQVVAELVRVAMDSDN